MSAAADRQAGALRRQVASAVRWNALLPLKVAATSAASLALANALVPTDYGIVVLVTSLAGLVGTWIDFGVERSLPKFYPEVERDAGRAGLPRFMREIALFKLAVVAALIVAMALGREWFFAFWAGRATDDLVRRQLEEQRWWLFGGLVALLALGAVFDVLMQVLVAFLRQKAFNLITLVTAVVQPLLLIGAVVLGLGVPGIVAALVLVPVLAVGLAWRTAWRTLAGVDAAGAAGLRPGFYRRLAIHALTNYGQQLTGLFQSFQFAVLFVGSLAAVAEFRVGYFLAAQPLQILFAPLNGIQVPLFARLREARDRAGTAAVYGLLSRFLLLVFVPAATGLALLAPNLTNVLWPKYHDSWPVAAVMAVCLFAASALSVARNVLMVHEVYPPVVAARLVSLASIPLLFWLPPRLGPAGAALAIGLTMVAAEAVAWVWARRALGLAYPWGFAGRALAATAVMAAVVWPLAAWVLPVPPTLTPAERAGPALLGQLLIGGLGAAVYLLVLRLLGGLTPADRAAIAELRLPGGRYLLRLL